jgi:type II secretion system protein I
MAGFTLLEVLVALVIVATALVTFMRLHLLSLDATIRAQDLTTAVLLAQGKLTDLGTFPETGEEQGKYEDPELSRFRWATVVTEHPLPLPPVGTSVPPTGVAPTPVIRRIEVTVHWVDGQQERHYTLASYGVGVGDGT